MLCTSEAHIVSKCVSESVFIQYRFAWVQCAPKMFLLSQADVSLVRSRGSFLYCHFHFTQPKLSHSYCTMCDDFKRNLLANWIYVEFANTLKQLTRAGHTHRHKPYYYITKVFANISERRAQWIDSIEDWIDSRHTSANPPKPNKTSDRTKLLRTE